MVDRSIGRRAAVDARIVRITSLPCKHCRYAFAPELFDCRQDAPFIVDDNVTLGGITPLDVIEGCFLVNVDQYTSRYRSGQAGASNLMGLKDDVTIRQDDGGAKIDQPFQNVDGGREQTIRKRIIDEVAGHGEQLDLARMLAPIPLQCSEVVAISELREKVIEDLPVAFASGAAIRTLEMIFQVPLDLSLSSSVLSTSIRKTTGWGVIETSKRSRRLGDQITTGPTSETFKDKRVLYPLKVHTL